MDRNGRLIPNEGRVLDLGCGFGLFTLYDAMTHPHTQFTGIDLSGERIRLAGRSAEKMGHSSVQFIEGDARSVVSDLTERLNLVFSITRS